MKGDKLLTKEEHTRAAQGIADLLLPRIAETKGRFIVTIAGESGSGKSEVAAIFSRLLAEKGLKSLTFQLDDYFVYPPKTNDKMRRQDIGHVGVSEVRLDLLDSNLKDISEGAGKITKPLVDYDEDLISEETVDLEGINVIIVEGTYTTLLKNAHRRVFIDRTYVDTREVRRDRGREEQDDYLERVLEIEHGIISKHKAAADIIVSRDYEVREATQDDRAGK